MKRILLSTALLIMVMSLVFAGGGQQSGSGGLTTIRFGCGWNASDGGQGQLGTKLIKDWAAKNNVNLQMEVVTGDEQRNKVQVDAAANNLADCQLFWGAVLCMNYARAGLLLNVDEYYKTATKHKKSDITDEAWSFYTVDGKQIGFPTDGYTGYFVCNQALFKKYGLDFPKTYDDMVAVSKVFNQNGIVPFAVGSKGGNPSHLWYSQVYAQLPNGNDEMYALNKNWNFNTQNAKATSQIIADMRNAGMFPKDTMANGDWNPSTALYTEGKAAMMYSFNWMTNAITMVPDVLDNSVLIPIPKMPGARDDAQKFMSQATNYGFLISAKSYADSKKTTILNSLIDFMLGDYITTAAQAGFTIPVDKTVNIDYDKMQNKFLGKVLKFNRDNNIQPSTCHYDNYPNTAACTDFQNFLDELWGGSMDAEQFNTACQRSLDRAKGQN